MLDVFVFVCRRDQEQASCLLQSLNHFMSIDAVASLNLAAIDDPAFLATMRQWQTGKFTDRTRYLSVSGLGLTDADHSYQRGWLLQQVAKLVFARQVRTEFYIVLDSKNLAIRDVAADDLVSNARALAVLEPTSHHPKWWRGSAWALQHRHFDRSADRLAMSSATPVVFHTASVLAMIEDLERRHGMTLEAFFLKRRPVRERFMQPTEFTLYCVYLDRMQQFHQHHVSSDLLHDTGTQMWASHGEAAGAARLRRLVGGETRGFFSLLALHDRCGKDCLPRIASKSGHWSVSLSRWKPVGLDPTAHTQFTSVSCLLRRTKNVGNSSDLRELQAGSAAAAQLGTLTADCKRRRHASSTPRPHA